VVVVSLVIPILLLGVMAGLSPTTLVVFILVLATTRAKVNAVAFLIGWGVSLTIVFYASYALGASHTTQRGSGRTAVELAEVLLGVGLVAVGVHRWGQRNAPRTSSVEPGAFTGRLKELSPRGAALVGVIKQPWAITAAAAVVVVSHHATGIAVVIAFAVFTIASTAAVGLIFLYYARQPGVAEARLAVLRERLVQAGPALFAVVAMLVGLIVAFDGLTGVLAD
jgi:hypothetical protein